MQVLHAANCDFPCCYLFNHCLQLFWMNYLNSFVENSVYLVPLQCLSNYYHLKESDEIEHIHSEGKNLLHMATAQFSCVDINPLARWIAVRNCFLVEIILLNMIVRTNSSRIMLSTFIWSHSRLLQRFWTGPSN